jgi:hypothetical protein
MTFLAQRLDFDAKPNTVEQQLQRAPIDNPAAH